MTEIPEHLLKRSRERREALGLSTGDEGGGDAPATPAALPRRRRRPAVEPAASLDARVPPPPAPPAVVAPPPSRRLPYVQAALRRKRIPYWAMPVVALLPLWAFIYQWSLTPPSAGDRRPARRGRGALHRELRVVPPPDGRRRLAPVASASSSATARCC